MNSIIWRSSPPARGSVSGKKHDQAVGRKQPVADAHAGMIGALRAHADGAEVEIEVLQFLDFDVAGQPGKGHGEIGAFHLAGQGVDEPLARAFAAENAQPAALVVDRREKRQSLDVIPVRVGDEQGEVQPPALEFLQQ